MVDLPRRHLLAGAACGLAVGALPTRLVLANAPTEKRLVLIILRGGMDGLSTVVPYADPDYRSLREGLALAPPDRENGVLDLDGFFGLHPALATLHDWYRQGDALALHAVASPYRERSHFDGQDLLEAGDSRLGSSPDGWLNRALSVIGGEQRLGLAVGQSVPLVLRGETPVMSWAPSALPSADLGLLDRLAHVYAGDPLFRDALAEGRRANMLAGAAMGDTEPASGRQEAYLQLADTAAGMLTAEDGPRIAVMDAPGWDTHIAQGTVNGALSRALGGLDAVLARLKDGLTPVWPETAIVIVTEFGRTVRPNGSGGTDHGTATAAFLAGGAVAGGRVIADWPGLGTNRLYEDRDLAPTADIRALFKGVLASHYGLPTGDLERFVFPDSTGVRPLDALV